MKKCHHPHIENDCIDILYIRSACEKMQHIADLDEIWVGWTQREDEISRKTVEVERSGRSLWFSLTEWKLWFEPWREIMNAQCLRSQRGDTLTQRWLSNPEAHTAPAGMSRNAGSAFISSPIGLANKLVQYKKRPLYLCSLKAAYTKSYEKNLWYKEFPKTWKTSPWCLSPSCYTFIKEGVT